MPGKQIDSLENNDKITERCKTTPRKKDRSDKLARALHYMLDHFCRALYPIELAESKQRQTTKQVSKQAAETTVLEAYSEH